MYIKRSDAIEVLGKLSREPHYQHTGEDYYAGVAEASGEIHSMPAASVVEVVRCKDCKHRALAGVAPFMYYRCVIGNGLASALKEDDFCSYGERKDT